MRPLQDDSTDRGFREGTQFDDVLRLYVFDRSLRLLVMDALERVEVAVRASISNTMSLNALPPKYRKQIARSNWG